MSVVLFTGAATGIGNLTARALAEDGHTVYASMRDINGRNHAASEELLFRRKGKGIELQNVAPRRPVPVRLTGMQSQRNTKGRRNHDARRGQRGDHQTILR